MISPDRRSHPARDPHELADDLDGTVDTVVVRLTDADGRTGIGEADAPPSVVKAYLEMPTAHLWSQNSAQLLLGADLVEVTALWERSTRPPSTPAGAGSASTRSRRSTLRSTTSPASSWISRPTS